MQLGVGSISVIWTLVHITEIEQENLFLKGFFWKKDCKINIFNDFVLEKILKKLNLKKLRKLSTKKQYELVIQSLPNRL